MSYYQILMVLNYYDNNFNYNINNYNSLSVVVK